MSGENHSLSEKKRLVSRFEVSLSICRRVIKSILCEVALNYPELTNKNIKT